jgi:hypothetical protein
MRMLGFDGVTKRFGPVAALDRCTFAVRPGRLTGFLGPNGPARPRPCERCSGWSSWTRGRSGGEADRSARWTGPGLSLRDVWRGRTARARSATEASAPATGAPAQPARVAAGERTATARTDLAGHRMLITVLTGVGVVLGVAVAVFMHDVIIGVTAGAGFIAIATQMVRLWARHTGPPVAHR